MTDIEQKALALLNEVSEERMNILVGHINRTIKAHEALCRAIEQHEATKQELSDFRQEVSDALIIYSPENRNQALGRFIITKPDPLAEVLAEVDIGNGWDDEEDYARQIHKALEARGLEIREKNDGR